MFPRPDRLRYARASLTRIALFRACASTPRQGKTIMDEIVWPLSNSLSSNKAWAVVRVVLSLAPSHVQSLGAIPTGADAGQP